MRVLVTGGTGVLGRALTGRLRSYAAAPGQIRVLSRRSVAPGTVPYDLRGRLRRR
jgi:uncharacterized protein YbjT (DUF2867 family)